MPVILFVIMFAISNIVLSHSVLMLLYKYPHILVATHLMYIHCQEEFITILCHLLGVNMCRTLLYTDKK